MWCDFIVMYLLKKRNVYREHKYQRVDDEIAASNEKQQDNVMVSICRIKEYNRTSEAFTLYLFSLLDHWNFGWMFLFFQSFSASDVLIVVLNMILHNKKKIL